MNEEIKVKWVEKLRSGEYVQGHGVLRFNDEYCCLGVLCDIVDPDGWDGRYYVFSDQSGFAAPPPPLMDEINLDNVAAITLIGMNDGMYPDRKHSFSEIADWIEENL